MRIANQAGRLVVVTGAAGHEIVHDVEKAGSGRYSADRQAVHQEREVFPAWAATA